MLCSMTGLGEARLEEGGFAHHLELRSVNQRYLKISIFVPDDFSFLEPEIERLIRARLTRGSVTYRLTVRTIGNVPPVDFDAAAVAAYAAGLRAAAGDDPRLVIDLATLLTLPGVCQTRELSEAERQQRTRAVEQLTATALESLMQMRTAEGRALAAELAGQCDVIRACLARIRERAGLVVVEYRDRLLERVRELVADSNVRLAEEDLLREVSVYAERSDVREELTRLDAHLDQFLELLASAEPAGRKLEFIAQEMLREANTMGSKTGDATIARDIIEIKSAVDRIKEQVANAE
jgi:uncharacterized protein (TIGR00255 family)